MQIMQLHLLVTHVALVKGIPRVTEWRHHSVNPKCKCDAMSRAPLGDMLALSYREILSDCCVVQPGQGLTALRFSESGLQCAAGMQNGLVALYDLRSSRPVIVKDHNYGAPIKDIKFHTSDSMAGLQLAVWGLAAPLAL